MQTATSINPAKRYTTKLQQESEDNQAIRYPEIAIIKNFSDKDEKVTLFSYTNE